MDQIYPLPLRDIMLHPTPIPQFQKSHTLPWEGGTGNRDGGKSAPLRPLQNFSVFRFDMTNKNLVGTQVVRYKKDKEML